MFGQRRSLLLAALVAITSAGAAAQEPLVVFVFDQNLDAVFRLEDRNHDGDMLDPGEVTRFFDDTVAGIGTENSQGLYALDPFTLLATDNFAPDDVVLLVDANQDGDAFDPGEGSEWFDGALPGGYMLTNPVTLSLGIDGAFYLIDNNTLDTANPEAVYRLEDLNDDGDVNDEGEVTFYFELSPPGVIGATTFDIEFDAAGAGYVIDITDPDQIHSLDRIDPTATTRTEWVDSTALYWGMGLLLSGGYELTYNPVTKEIIADTTDASYYTNLIALRDRNGNGHIDVPSEVRVIWGELTHAAGLSVGAARDIMYADDGSLVWIDNQYKRVFRLYDYSGDGDYNDEGETIILYSSSAAEAVGLPVMANLLSCTVVRAPLAGDCDGDDVVDWGDTDDLVECLLGPENGLDTGCRCVDMDGDDDVDLADVAEFQTAFSG